MKQPEETENSSEHPPIFREPDEVAGIYWTLNETAKQTGVSKATLSKDASAGKIQWHDRPEGRRFHAAEIFHFYRDKLKRRENRNTLKTERTPTDLPLVKREPLTENPYKTAAEHRDLTLKLTTAEQEIRHLQELLEIERQRREQERERREKAEQDQERWHQAYQELKALPAPIPQNDNLPTATDAPATHKTWLQKWFRL